MIEMIETLSGGEYSVDDSGILLDNSLQSVCYIGLFGGNLKESTKIERKPGGAIYEDFWGNCDVLNDDAKQFNSEFEKAISTLPINSGNLIAFETAAENDLIFLVEKKYVESISASVSILGPGEIRVDILITQPSITEDTTYSFIWNETLQKAEMV